MISTTYHRRREEGLCPMCGRERDEAEHTNCSACRALAMDRYYKDAAEKTIRRLKLEALFSWVVMQGKIAVEDWSI